MIDRRDETMGDIGAYNSEVPNYGGTVFISYARADDEQCPLYPTGKGWVSFFWDLLRYKLTDVGLHQAELWLDRYQIEPAECFTQKIEAALKKAHIIVPILSPNWGPASLVPQGTGAVLRVKGT
jgi:hypothetical protein